MVTQNAAIASYTQTEYQPKALEELWDFLLTKGTLSFSALDNGLFPAAATGDTNAYTGYEAVWVRDNVYVAYAHYLNGNESEKAIALKTVRSLAEFFQQERLAFEHTISAGHAPASQMDRPHVRFKGQTLERIEQPWNQAQNDALGYFLWFFCQLILEDALEPTAEDYSLLTLFPLYFEAIQYWQDEDSGHWEEDPKIEASSIGVVVAGLKTMREVLTRNRLIDYLKDHHGRTITSELLNRLIEEGEEAIAQTLPSESIQPGKERRYDSALLFLAYPLQVLEEEQIEQTVTDITENLQGKYGISRYKEDSFWCRDYKDLPENIRTNVSKNREGWMKERGRSLNPGEEAQWCIFDPILSALYGQQYQETREAEDLKRQTYHLNRALGQVTTEDFHLGGFKCPELYYLQSNEYIPNDATPLLWTQANLLIALKWMRISLSES